MKHLFNKIKIYLKNRLTKIYPVYIPVYNGSLLKNKTVLITGGTSGIGMSIAKTVLMNEGTVVITGRFLNRLISAKDELLSISDIYKDRIFISELDNTNISDMKIRFDEITKSLGDKKIDVLINNAGLVGGNFGSLSEEEYDKIMDTNLKGTFFLCQIVATYMKENSIQGNILNIASSSSLRPAYSAYTLSKWGIRGLTLGLAKALIKYGIVVNGIAPGPTATPMLLNDMSNLFLQTNPTGRYATAQEIANLAVVLISDLGRMVVGDVLYATGGSGLITFDDTKYEF